MKKARELSSKLHRSEPVNFWQKRLHQFLEEAIQLILDGSEPVNFSIEASPLIPHHCSKTQKNKRIQRLD